jgi:hypothetical protein
MRAPPSLLLLAAAALLGCASGRPERNSLSCRGIDGIAPLLAPGSALLLGEMHGTEESPAFLADVVCRALADGRSVSVALEVPAEEAERVSAFLASGGAPSDRQALLAGPFWTADYQDGRRSVAMAALFERLRGWRAAGHGLRVELIDAADLAMRPAERDRTMGQRLAALHRADPEGVIVSLTGNIHSRTTRGTPWVADFEPAGFVLKQVAPALRVTALDVSYPSGTAWTCASADPASCGARNLSGKEPEPAGREVWLYPAVRGGHHGAYRIASLTASRPAVGSTEH